jgi:hypothetical protein
LPHSSTHEVPALQTPTTQGRQAPLGSHTSPSGQGQLVPPQLSRQLALSAQDGTHGGLFVSVAHPARAASRTTNLTTGRSYSGSTSTEAR